MVNEYIRAFTASLILSFVIVLALVLAVRLFIDTPLLSHDIKENRKKILIAMLLVPLSFFGPLFFIAGSLLLLGLYFRGMNKTVVYVSVLFLLLSPIWLNIINMFFSVPSSELRAIVAVNESRDNKYAASVLKNKADFISLFPTGLLSSGRDAMKRQYLPIKNFWLPILIPGLTSILGIPMSASMIWLPQKNHIKNP